MIDQISGFYTRNRQKFRSSTLLLSVVVLALVAQSTLTLSTNKPGFWDVSTWWTNLGNNSSPLPGLILYALAGLIFIIALHTSGDITIAFTISTDNPKSREPRFGFWITSLGLAGLTAFYTANSTPTTYALAYGIVSCISIFLFYISVFYDERWLIPTVRRIHEWINTHKSELFVLLTILIAAFLIRYLDLELHPYSFINDEGEMGRNGACIMQGTCLEIMEIGWSQQPRLAFLPTGLSISLLGNTALAVRLVSVIIGTLAVLAVYLFTREVFDKRTAWVAALLLATLPVHVHFSRIGVDNIVDSLSTTLMIWLLFRGIKRSSTFCFLAAGVLGGLCFYTYPGSRLAPIIGLFILGYIGLKTRGVLQAHGRNFLIFLLAFVITAAPILGFFVTHPENFSARMNGVGIFQNNAIQNEMNIYKSSAFEVLTQQFMKSSLVFIVTGAPSNFYNSPKPYLATVAAIFFMLGLAYTLWRIKDPRYLGLFVWFWAAIILGSTLTVGPPSNQRMLMSTSALSIITALGISKSVGFFPQTGKFIRWLAPLSLLAFVLYIGYLNINFYFNEYRINHYFEDPTNELTYETRSFIAPLHTTGRFFLIAEPDVPYLSFPNFNYFSPDVEKAYFNEVTPQTLAALPNDKDALFIATSTRGTDLANIARLIPGGEWHEFRRRYQPGEILFYSYKIEKHLLQSFKP
jgi:4-amino-4-deoxy-L-arabinose transferase-like glycosyltransferase